MRDADSFAYGSPPQPFWFLLQVTRFGRSQCLFALLEERLEYRGESPSFSGIRIQLLQPVHDSCVVRAELLRQAVGLSTKGFGGFGILFLLGLIYLR
jgi:hypothetical protein